MARAHPLICRFADNSAELTEAELDELIALLRHSPELAVALRQQLLINDYVSQKLAIDRQNFFAQIGQRIVDFERGEEEMYNHVAELRAIAEAELDRPVQAAPAAGWLKYALAAALSLAIVGAVVMWRFGGQEALPVALIEELSGQVQLVRGGRSWSPELGKAVSTGDQVVSTAGSTIVWKYKDGTTVRLVGEGAATVSADRPSGAKQVTLDRGELLASVVPQKRGPMVFHTPHATATVRGTELRLVVGQAATQLDVAIGLVDLTRRSDGRTIQVAASESGVASRDAIALKLPQWPLNRSRAIFLLEGDPAGAVARNPDSGNFRQTPLERAVEDGPLASADAGELVTRQVRAAGQFSVELAVVPQAATEEAATLILSLGPPAEPNFELWQEGMWLLARVRSAQQAEPVELNLGEVAAGKRAHVLLACRGDRLTGYLDGRQTAEKTELALPLKDWLEGPLVVAADGEGRRSFTGSVQQAAVFGYVMDRDEARREHERFLLVYPP
jgi:hypothetical protein